MMNGVQVARSFRPSLGCDAAMPAVYVVDRADRLQSPSRSFERADAVGVESAPARARAMIGMLAPWQLRRAQELLAARLDGRVDVATIAAQCGLSPGYFERAFARSTGKPPHRWLRERRVERSKELLLTSSLSIAEITLECGFADQPHLTRVFSAAVGMSPGRWRRMHKR